MEVPPKFIPNKSKLTAMGKNPRWQNSMMGQSCFIPKFLRMKLIIWLKDDIIPKFMQEFLLDISIHNLRMSNRAYVETKEPLFQTAPLRFKSAKLGVSEMVYSLVFKLHSFPLSVIPKISKNFVFFINIMLWAMNIIFDKYPLEFSFSINEWLGDITACFPQVIGKSFSLTFSCT